MADTNLHERLQRDGYTPEQPLAVRKVVATAEKGRRYVLQVSNSKESVVYKIDGYIITAGSKCDKMVLIKDSSNIRGYSELVVMPSIGRFIKNFIKIIVISSLARIFASDISRHSENVDFGASVALCYA